MSYRRIDRDLHEAAASRGQVVVVPRNDEVFVDLDNPGDQYVLEAMLALLKQHGIRAWIAKTTRSKHGNKHVYVRIDIGRPLSDIERVAFQAALGSDRKRELLGILRALGFLQASHVSVFFENPNAETEEPGTPATQDAA